MKTKLDTKAIAVACVVVAIIIASIIFFTRSAKVKDVKKNNQLVDEVNNEVKVSDITLTQLQLSTMVERLYKAMKGLGTDEDAIYEVFGMCRSRSDVLSLIAKFGIKDGMSLSEWIYDELSGTEIAHLNSVLESNGISDYQFKF